MKPVYKLMAERIDDMQDQMAKEIEKVQSEEYHYFAVCGLGWATDKKALYAADKVQEAFQDQVFSDTELDIFVYRVPLPEDSTYHISFFKPVVDGIQCVMHTKVNGTRARPEKR